MTEFFENVIMTSHKRCDSGRKASESIARKTTMLSACATRRRRARTATDSDDHGRGDGLVYGPNKNERPDNYVTNG